MAPRAVVTESAFRLRRRSISSPWRKQAEVQLSGHCPLVTAYAATYTESEQCHPQTVFPAQALRKVHTICYNALPATEAVTNEPSSVVQFLQLEKLL